MKDYYQVKTMDTPSPSPYGINSGEKVLLIGTAKPQAWAVTIDIDPASPAEIIGNGIYLPFCDKCFDVVILDYVTNFLKYDWQINKMIDEANRVGKRVAGRCTVTKGEKKTLRGAKQRFTHKDFPSGVEWINGKLVEVRI